MEFKLGMNKIIIERDQNSYCAHFEDFENLQVSVAGFGQTLEEAISDLCMRVKSDPTLELKIWS